MPTQSMNDLFGTIPWQTRLILILLVVSVLAGCTAGSSDLSAPATESSAEPAATTATPAQENGADTDIQPTAEPQEEVDEASAQADENRAELPVIPLDHVHGMGWDPAGQVLTVATHTGLRLFADDQWFESKGPAHDYIALAPTADGYYASGHPAPSATEGNPLGLVKSTDRGETLEMLSFEGESEIHFLGAGYETNAVYVVVDAENSTVAPGLHYTLDDGANWQTSAAQGITSVTIQLAVHPTDPAVIAFGTEGGVLLSTDNGNSFTRITDSIPLSAVTFSPAEEGVLYFGLRTLMRLDSDGSEAVALNMPDLSPQDAMIAIAINPRNRDEIAIATFDSYLWQTVDGGDNWQLIGSPSTS